jgi:gluconokinase
MLDKARLHARGRLPPGYEPNLGEKKPFLLDARCCRFLGVPYAEVVARTLAGGCDEEVLAWAHARGGARGDESCHVWSSFMVKLGWRDERAEALRQRIAAAGIAGAGIETSFEYIDADEGRPPGGTALWEGGGTNLVVVMGVAGSGKSIVGRSLAAALGWDFVEGDDLHPAENVAKMASGTPLGDAERAPWLEAVRAEAESRRGAKGCVVACSALKEAYRLALAPDPAQSRFVYLKSEFELARGRLVSRKGHFMKEGMLRSQFDALEEPTAALTADASQEPSALVAGIRAGLGLA